MPRRMYFYRTVKETSMNEENFYDPEKPEEYVYDPEGAIDYELFFKNLWDKENEFLRSVGVDQVK